MMVGSPARQAAPQRPAWPPGPRPRAAGPVDTRTHTRTNENTDKSEKRRADLDKILFASVNQLLLGSLIEVHLHLQENTERGIVSLQETTRELRDSGAACLALLEFLCQAQGFLLLGLGLLGKLLLDRDHVLHTTTDDTGQDRVLARTIEDAAYPCGLLERQFAILHNQLPPLLAVLGGRNDLAAR